MYRSLGTGRLTSGERLELGVVEAPDPQWRGRIMPFLAHKAPEYQFHVDRSFNQPPDGLTTRYYVASIAQAKPVAHVMVAGAHGYGIFAHVYTAPSWRRRGAFGQLLVATMSDVAALGFEWLTLVTRAGGVPYQIYRSIGFRPLIPGSGEMCWSVGGPEAQPPWQPGEATVHATQWGDWGAYNLVAVHPPEPGELTPHAPSLGIDEQGSAESSFLRLHRVLEDEPQAQAQVLRIAGGGVVGWCHLVPSPMVLAGAWLLDVHALPGFEHYLSALLAPIRWPEAPVVFLAAGPANRYVPHLRGAGFRSPVRLSGLARHRGDLRIWVRPVGKEASE